MAISDITPIEDLVTRLDAEPPARFSYTETAYTDNDIEGTDAFSLSLENNIPKDDDTEYNSTVLDRGARSQAASIPRMAWDHFIGRFSYNLRKLTQQVLAFFGAQKKIWAHNAMEYDAEASYLVGDVCYVMGTSGGVPTVQFFKRISTSPLGLVGVAPAAGTDWAIVQYRTGAFSLLPITAPGFKHQYSVADLTSGTYDTTKWYPVTTDPMTAAIPATIEDSETLQVLIEAFTVGAVAGLTGNQRAELAVLSKFNGYDASSGSIILNNSVIKVSDGSDSGVANSPIGYSVLPKGQQAVVWLKGGSKYALWNSAGATFTVHTSSYSNPGGDPAVVPGTARVFSVTLGTISAVVAGYAALASPAFTGNPTAPTQAALDSSTKLANTQYADAAVGVEKTRALAAEAAISSASGLTYVQTAVTEAGLTWDPTDAFLLDKANVATSHIVGEDLYLPMPEVQVWLAAAKSSLNPTYPRYNPIIARDVDKTITDAMAPLLVTKLRGFAASSQGVGSFAGTVVASAITWANTTPGNIAFARIVEEGLVRRWFSSGQNANFAASGPDFTGMTVTAAGVEYPIVSINLGTRVCNVTGTPPGGSQTIEFHPYRIAGSSTSIQLPRLSGFVPVGANDADGAEMEGYRHMDTGHGHRHLPLSGTGFTMASAGSLELNAGAGANFFLNAATTGDPTTDTVNGNFRPAKNTSPRTVTRNIYTHAGVLNAAA